MVEEERGKGSNLLSGIREKLFISIVFFNFYFWGFVRVFVWFLYVCTRHLENRWHLLMRMDCYIVNTLCIFTQHQSQHQYQNHQYHIHSHAGVTIHYHHYHHHHLRSSSSTRSLVCSPTSSGLESLSGQLP